MSILFVMTTVHRPRKRFGQHFLQDKSILDRMVEAIQPAQNDPMVEIGPGLGALTKRLLTQVQHLDAVELDRDIIPLLIAACHDLPGELSVHQGDVLAYDFRALTTLPASLRIVGNLPYNISTPLLFHLLEQSTVIKDMYFMLQKEVVDRIVAPPGGKEYGRLSIMVQCRCAVERLFIVGRDAFNPPPKVDSAVIKLVPYRTPPITITPIFTTIVREAFNHRRKTIRNSLRAFVTVAQLIEINIDPISRPEQLSMYDFEKISRLFYDL
ncbi:MAG: 16S rRNA (adenine(1518)-N(6)/adenine(1519)-N(6))-dimethyltransferase RsmA [Gammaproteobacteria bacterium]